MFQHERIGLDVGIPMSQIIALRDSDMRQFNDKEKAVINFTDDMFYRTKATDEAFNRLLQLGFSHADIVELTMAVSFYRAVSMFLETMQVDGEEGQAQWLLTAKI